MTYAFKNRPQINFSELDGKFWINDGDDVLWFESVLEAQDMARELEIGQAVAKVVEDIAHYVRMYPASLCCLERDKQIADEIEIQFGGSASRIES